MKSILARLIQSHLSDPRIQGLVSVTRVEVSPDLKNAGIYLSVMGVDDAQQQLCLRGIQHAGGFLRTCLAKELSMKSCPRLKFVLDSSIKKEIQILEILDQIAKEHQPDEAATPPAQNLDDIG